MIADLIDEWHQRCGTGPDPIGQCRGIEVDTLLGVDVALPIERQMGPILGEQNLGQTWRPELAG